MWSVFIFTTTWLFRFSICDFLLANPRLSFLTLYFSKQYHYLKSSLLLLIPISKLFTLHWSSTILFSWPCEYRSLFMQYDDTYKRYGCIVFTYSLKMLLWLIESSAAICLPIWRKTHIILYTITFIPYVIQWKQPPSTFL